MVWSSPHAGSVFSMDLVDHASDPVCLRGSAQGWTPPVGLHRLWTLPRAPGEEAAAQDHQQDPGPIPWERDRQGPGAQHIVRIQETKRQQTVCRSGGSKLFSPRATYRKIYEGLGHSLEVYCLISSVISQLNQSDVGTWCLWVLAAHRFKQKLQIDYNKEK